MVVMARFMKEKYPNHLIVFVGPCFSKKQEAKENKEVDFALTFKEVNDMFLYAKKNGYYTKKENESKHFDKFYNDYTKVYPLSGAVAQTMHAKDILKENQILIASHSHRAYFKPEEKYINTGFIHGSHAQYLIIGDEEIELKREFHKLIFYSHLRNHEIFRQILMSESAILFENIEKQYLKT
jgi:iron only hydrogenase large subunit-like protein